MAEEEKIRPDENESQKEKPQDAAPEEKVGVESKEKAEEAKPEAEIKEKEKKAVPAGLAGQGRQEEKKEKVAEEKKEEVAEEKKEEVAEEKKEEVAEEKKDEAKGDKKWYVVQTFSGQEDKVKESIVRNVENMNMQHKIFKVLVPEEETVEIKGGKRIEKVKKMFPGYVFIEMILDDESWYVIRGTPGVAKFIGTKVKPTPVSDKEMQRVLKQIGIKEEKLEAAFDVGESVRIIGGPFRGYTGSVDEVNAQKGKLKTLINIFGRDTPVEVNFEQVQKIT